MLTLATLRLPVAYTALFALVALALLLVLLGTSTASSGLTKTGGVVVLVFAALGVYLYSGTAAAATGRGRRAAGQAASCADCVWFSVAPVTENQRSRAPVDDLPVLRPAPRCARLGGHGASCQDERSW